MRASFEGPAVFFVVLLFFRVEKSWSLLVRHVVVGPLSCGWIKERVSKEFLLVVDGGGAPAAIRGGRAVPWKGKIYDSTKGFPGEDVSP